MYATQHHVHMQALHEATSLLTTSSSSTGHIPAFLQGGGKRRNKNNKKKQASPKVRGKGTRASAPSGGGKQVKKKTVHHQYDHDLLLQEFNHTGKFDLQEEEIDSCTKDVIIPLVLSNVRILFAREQGQHKVSTIVAKNGTPVPDLPIARAQLTELAEECRKIDTMWMRGQYHTIQTSPDMARNTTTVFAAVATLLDHFQKLSLPDAKLTMTGLLFCTLRNHEQLRAHDLRKWRQHLDGGGNSVIQSAQMQRNMGRNQFSQRQLEREIGRVRQMNQQLLTEDAASDPIKLSRSLLVLQAVHRLKRERLTELRTIDKKTQAMLQSGEIPTSVVELNDTADAATTTRGNQRQGKPASVDGTLATQILQAQETPEADTTFDEDRTIQKQTDIMYWGGGVSRKDMIDPVEVLPDIAGPGVPLYAYVNSSGNMCTNVALEDLNKLPQREMAAPMKKRVQYLHHNAEKIGKMLQQGGTSQETRALALEASRSSDSELASTLHGLMSASAR